jgi:hypothetical protein
MEWVWSLAPGWLLLAVLLAVPIGRGIRLADLKAAEAAGCRDSSADVLILHPASAELSYGGSAVAGVRVPFVRVRVPGQERFTATGRSDSAS